MNANYNKYGNRKVEADGYVFASVAEHRRYQDLKLMAAAGEISELIVHPGFDLAIQRQRPGPNGIIVDYYPIARYIADFAYDRKAEDGTSQFVVEDVKGVRTHVYNIKKRLMKALYGIDIQEIAS